MKRVVLVVFLFLFIFVTPFVFTQEPEYDESEMYFKTVFITKVYPHQLGYRIIYQKSNLSLGEVFVPHDWFTQAGGKGEVYFDTGPSIPYMTIYWDEGEFSHVRLYLHADLGDLSWGMMDNSPELNEQFDVETIEPDF